MYSFLFSTLAYSVIWNNIQPCFWLVVVLIVFVFLLILYLDARNPFRTRLRTDKAIDRYDTRTKHLHLFDWLFENFLLKSSDNVPEVIVNLFLPMETSSKGSPIYVELDKINRITERTPIWKQVAFDLHTHTDVLDIFPSRKKCKYVRSRAISNGLSGIACTCHNRVRFPEYGVEFTDADFLWLTSQEITMQPPFNLKSQKRRGSNKYLNSFHCNAHGTTRNIAQAPNMTTQDVINEIHKHNGLANFNHPAKSLIDFFPLFDTIEIWNGRRVRQDVIDYWEHQYIEGVYRPGLAGSDFHSHRGRKGYSDIGIPRSILLVRELNRLNVMEAISNGRCYLTMGSAIDFWVSASSKDAEMGSTMKVNKGQVAKICANGISTLNGLAKVRVNKRYKIETEVINQIPFDFNVDFLIDDDISVRVDIFNEKNELILVTNPIFIKVNAD